MINNNTDAGKTDVTSGLPTALALHATPIKYSNQLLIHLFTKVAQTTGFREGKLKYSLYQPSNSFTKDQLSSRSL